MKARSATDDHLWHNAGARIIAVLNVDAYIKKLERALQVGNATEHSHRPALCALIESVGTDLLATNEPRRIACGAPDYIVSRSSGRVPIGYVEAKDVGVSLDAEERSQQLQRYRHGLANLILTDYLEFRWYVRGELRLTARVGTVEPGGRVRLSRKGISDLQGLFEAFIAADLPAIDSPKVLALHLAGLARLTRDLLIAALQAHGSADSLRDQMDGFRKILLHELTSEQFADMYAQTIAYGLFAARCNARPGQRFTREHAAHDLPRTNPFLRRMFSQIAGPELDDRINWVVDDTADLLDRADMHAILRDFGGRPGFEDPVVHFYETFLAAYDPKMREARGVYYTPEPVVSYIVRSVDHLLKKQFKLADGLADSSLIQSPSRTRSKGASASKNEAVHRVQILDPATGTGTFLHGVIAAIRQTFRGNRGMWSSYVSEHLLPRLFGFELLMAPYAVAHMKLGLQLARLEYDFKADERLRIYLTNTLEEVGEQSDMPLFTRWLADEARAAADVKRERPVMVVLGNPPYSGHSENRGDWIRGLLDTYKEGCPELKKPAQAKWLSDDYVKFFRFAQWRIEQTGEGILAFISNHGYLDNPTFRGMRRSLMNTFDRIYILDLHGNAKKKEQAPDGSKDENVFDIQQGVAIGIFVKRRGLRKGPPEVRHAHLFGRREEFGTNRRDEVVLSGGKYHWLWENDVGSTDWSDLEPREPAFLFVPEDRTHLEEYEQGIPVPQIFRPIGDPAPGIVTTQDEFAISWSAKEAVDKVDRLVASRSEDDARRLFRLCSQSQWDYARAKRELGEAEVEDQVVRVLYRPFDYRYTIWNRNVAVHRRERVMRHMIDGNNLALITSRMTKGESFRHAQVTRTVSEVICMSPKTSNNGFVFPLYLDDDSVGEEAKGQVRLGRGKQGFDERRPNLDPRFLERVSAGIGMRFTASGAGDLRKTFGPEDVFHYVYAVLHAPTYRERYSEFLKSDFPRIPMTSNPELFRRMVKLGRSLVELHLFERTPPVATRYPIAGDSRVEAVHYDEPEASRRGRIWINPTQYFDGVEPETWHFQIGGYQVCAKWLKDRRGRRLSYDDLTHFQQIVATVGKTMTLMAEVDNTISKNGGWPVV